MTERDLTVKLMALLEEERGPFEQIHIIKHADRFTGGIPDLSFTTEGITSWVEVKYLPEGLSSLKRAMRPGQVTALGKLWRAGAPAWLVVQSQSRLVIYSGEAVAIADRNGWKEPPTPQWSGNQIHLRDVADFLLGNMRRTR